MTVQELNEQRKIDTNLQVIDVREGFELEICKLENILHVPLGSVQERLGEIPKDKKLVILCHHGVRSQRAANILIENGFENVYNLEGGIDAWADEIDIDMQKY